ncbi:uncharacterized protein LOC117565529 [Drosophila albomicans]|uniref:Uncharacterized protein LOC117565529 n=1 Tax=Drosophila albomicans TaxID=7291 RepID=A0A6P8WAE0_DROAB|nr:uncharacterized protein LOC117565529 [Drosophila albomicans]
MYIEMELRSNSKHLMELLKSYGAYEDGMELEEMKQVAQAMEMSAVSTNAMECLDLERALLESEFDFRMSSNSTMIADPVFSSSTSPLMESFIGCRSFDRNCDSPPTNPIHMEVHAVVHHELNWSPTAAVAARPLKRHSNEIVASDMQSPKRQLRNVEANLADATPISMTSSDSGVCDEIGTLSSIASSDQSTMPSIGEVPSRLLISTSSAAVSTDFSNCIDSSNL